MAKYISHIASEIRGSVNGATYARNRYGAYIRAKASPVQPNTPFQATARQILTAIAQAWRTLSPEQRSEWNARANEMSRQDSLGMSYRMSGLQLYTLLNSTRARLQLPRQDDPEQLGTAPPPITSLTIGDLDDPDWYIAFTPTPYAGALLVWASPPLSPGVSFIPRSKLRLVTVVKPTTFGGTVTSPINIWGPYKARFDIDPSELSGFTVAVALTPVSYSSASTAGYPGTRITTRRIALAP